MSSPRPQEIRVLKQTPAMKTYLGYDAVREQNVIVKEVCLDAMQSWISAFRMEIEVLQAIESGWMPRLLDQGYGQQSLWFSETFLEGESLDDWLEKKPDRHQKEEIFRQIIRLVSQVHQAGYLYLDLKADNILIRHGHACLIDFNAALPIGSSRPLLASRESLPPEGAMGLPMSEKADQIGLGRLHLKLLGPSLVSWIALSRKPEKRFRSLGELERAAGRAQRLRPKAAVACLLILAGTLVPIGMGVLSHEFAEQSEETVQQDRLPSAAEYCKKMTAQQKENKEGRVELQEWLLASRAALNENHLGLAGYLYSHLPKEKDQFSVRLDQALLALMLHEDIRRDDLEALIEEVPAQIQYDEQLVLLFQVLSEQKVFLTSTRLSSLFEQIAPLEEPSKDLCRNALAYLIECRKEGMERIKLPAPIEEAMQNKAADLWKIYSQSEDDPSASSSGSAENPIV